MIRMYDGPSLTQGPKLDLFERELAHTLHVSAESVVAVSSGTAALHLAYELAPPALVPLAVPAITFIATVNTAIQAGVKIKIVDVTPDTWTVQDTNLPTVTVDLYGRKADPRNIFIEDAAESIGSDRVPDAPIACFSFEKTKMLTTGGEGGAVTFKDQQLAELARIKRGQGKPKGVPYHQVLGYNYRMTEWQATYGLRELRLLQGRIKKRRHVNKLYRESLPDFTFQDSKGSNCWGTALLLENRNEVIKRLGEAQIQSAPVFSNLKRYPWLVGEHAETPVADFIEKHGLVLPCHQNLTANQINRVSRLVQEHGKPTAINS